MAIDCANQPCEKVSPLSRIVSLFGDTTAAVPENCSTTLIYLTDDEGLNDQTDSGSGALLSTDNRSRQISSSNQVDMFFSKCSRTHFELSRFFSYNAGTLVRPKSVTIAYFDSSEETMLDAVKDLDSCGACFYTLTHVQYDKDGTALGDTVDSKELGEWGSVSDNRVITVLPSIDEENLTSLADTESMAYLSKQAGDKYAVYSLLNEECVDGLDDSCEPDGSIINVYGMQHLVLAGVIASISSDSTDYSFNVKFSPQGGNKLSGVSTTQLSDSNIDVVKGSSGVSGGVMESSPHHVNVYSNIGGYRIFEEGISAVGDYISDLIHKRYIKDTLEKTLMEMLVSSQNVSMIDSSLIISNISLIARSFVSKGIITDVPESINKDEFENVYLSGNGWVMTRDDITQTNVSTRITPTFTFCYVGTSGSNYISIGLCESSI